jgi:hypothetical protein
MACNKYIFDTEKKDDAYQKARAQFLRRGVQILEERRKKELEEKWARS